jgi:hypothetical protein
MQRWTHALAPTKLNSRHSWSTNLPSCILIKPRCTAFASVAGAASTRTSKQAAAAAICPRQPAMMVCTTRDVGVDAHASATADVD